MKLLYCDVCGDIFNLTGIRVKECHCGNVKGVYISHSDAITNGNGHSIAIGNGALHTALFRKTVMEKKDENFDRRTYLKDCNIEYSWVRPNEGEGNPHQFVVDSNHWGWGIEEDENKT